MGMGKKIIFGTAITLALLLSGCGESAEDKAIKENKAKVELFEKIKKIDVKPKPENSNDFLEQVDLLKKDYEKEFGDKKVELWIEEFKKDGMWRYQITMHKRMKY